jgi:hypothetical protein
MNHRVPPDDFDTFDAACRAADAKCNGKATADNVSSDQTAADDWLAAFAKKSQEALAKRAAEKQADLARTTKR